jgi:hypothetical protein
MNAVRVLHFGNSWFTSKQREWAPGMRSSVRARVAFNSACLSFSVRVPVGALPYDRSGHTDQLANGHGRGSCENRRVWPANEINN